MCRKPFLGVVQRTIASVSWESCCSICDRVGSLWHLSPYRVKVEMLLIHKHLRFITCKHSKYFPWGGSNHATFIAVYMLSICFLVVQSWRGKAEAAGRINKVVRMSTVYHMACSEPPGGSNREDGEDLTSSWATNSTSSTVRWSSSLSPISPRCNTEHFGWFFFVPTAIRLYNISCLNSPSPSKQSCVETWNQYHIPQSCIILQNIWHSCQNILY